MALVHTHLVAALVDIDDLIDILDIESGVDALGEHIVGDRKQVYIPGALAVAQKRPFHALCAGQERELGGGDTAAAVIVGVDAEDNAVAVLEMPAHPFDLVRIDIGGVHLYRGGKIEDHRLFPGGLPDVLYGCADLQCKIKLCAGKALRRILENEISGEILCTLFYPACSPLCDLDDALPVHIEHDIPLEGRSGVVNVENDVFAAPDRLKGPLDLLFSALGEDLDIDIIRDHVIVDEFPEKIILDLAGRGESDLDFLEAQLEEETVHLHLLTDHHRIDQGLVAVAKIHAAPYRCLFDLLVGPLPLGIVDNRVFRVFLVIQHVFVTPFLKHIMRSGANAPKVPKGRPARSPPFPLSPLSPPFRILRARISPHAHRQ